MSEAATVHIIETHGDTRASLLMMMESASLTARAYDSARRFLEEADLMSPGCCVLNLGIADMRGMESLRQLHAHGCDIPVVIISEQGDVETAVDGMKLGAVDVVQRPFEPRKLIEAIRREIKTSTELYHRRAQTADIRRRIETLTQRELDLLKRVVSGQSNKQIAASMGISIKTVANHRANLMAKTQAINAADLARMSIIAGVRLDQ
ncbi:MAG: response regulator [Tepidisphaeraceae bacterium]